MLSAAVISALSMLSLSMPQTPAVPVRVDLAISYVGQVIKADVTFAEPTFFGGVIVSLTPDLVQSFVGLPPLLNNAVVLGIGQGESNHLLFNVPANLPVGLVIYSQGVALGTQGVDELAHDVAAVRCVLDGEVRERGVEHREAVVMLRREHRVLHAEPLREPRPPARAPGARGEGPRGGVVVLDRDALALGKRRRAADQRP